MNEETTQDEKEDVVDDLEFPIVLKLLKPLYLKDKAGTVVQEFAECIIEREPEYDEILLIQKLPSDKQLKKCIELLTNIPSVLAGRIGSRDIIRIESRFMVFFGK